MDERPFPKFENAPGVVIRRQKVGWEVRWLANSDLVRRGYGPRVVSIIVIRDEPTESERAFVSDECRRLQDDMLRWSRGGIPLVGRFDGTVRSLIYHYQTDQDSPYHKGQYRSRLYSASLCGRIEKTTWTDENGTQRTVGEESLCDIRARMVLRWHEIWSKGGKIAMGHAMVSMFRTLCSFGVTMLEDRECERLSGVLHKMKFKVPRPRETRLTAEQVIAIRAEAHRRGQHSIALAQALQFELMLRQKDVIGEWVPQSEPLISPFLYGTRKWVKGLRWSEIDQNLILRHTTSKRQKDIEVDLKLAPMVMEELALIGDRPERGPVIIRESTKRPYDADEFRRLWRGIATAVGVPKTVRNMDSRAGGISEATDAGADLEHVRHAATHSDIGMTQKYSRAGAEKTRNVMLLRVAHRNKK